ncbi:MAG: TlyA family RNA methyltransferase, partial [Firmicutes bacterium]|nr:TlyA family RNA methyltransferase [Bacillota bacterium]
CGASTGGFTDVLLQHGAARVYAVDVGYGQLAWKLRTDERVVNIERTNLRYISEAEIPEPLDLAVMDVSFISIRLVLPAVQQLLKDGADLICLIKPQFEAGREAVGKKGVVRDPSVHKEVIRQILDFAASRSLRVEGLDYSPIKGPEGNIEYICHMKNSEGPAAVIGVDAVVAASHDAL